MWEPQLALADHGWRVLAPHLGGADDLAGGAGRIARPWTTSPERWSTCSTRCTSMTRSSAVSRWAATSRWRCSGSRRDTFAAWCSPTRGTQADTPEGIEGRKRMLALVREKGAAAVADEMLPKLLADATRERHPEIVARVRALMLANSAEAIANAITALMTRTDTTPLLQTIHCPTLILVGDRDGITPPPLSEAMHHAIAGSELVVIEGAGHLTNLEQPACLQRGARAVPRASGIVEGHACFNGPASAFAAWRLRRDKKAGHYVLVVALLLVAVPRAQEVAPPVRRSYDEILDLNVRDGFVYYRALKSDRAKLDGFIATLATADIDKASRDDQIAFWINAYNALVLRTVVDHYPIAARAPDVSAAQHPADSGRLRARGAPRGRPHADARSDRAGRALDLSRPARVPRARARRRRRWTAAQRSVHRRAARGAAEGGRRASASAAPSACTSIATRTRSP